MTTAPGELTANALIGLIESGAYPREIVATIARGFLPLPQEELIGVLAYLAASGDAEIAELARTTLSSEIPSKAMFDYASNENAQAEHLERLMLVTADAMVLEALIRNRSVSDSAVASLARRAAGPVQEVIVINQARIIRAPEILDALLDNPTLTPDARRRALETREEFFEKKARVAQLAAEAAAFVEPELMDAPDEPIADLLERADSAEGAAATSAISMQEIETTDETKAALWTQLQSMSVAQKVQLAYRGDRTVRLLLVRERNKLICSAVMRNPRMTEQEAESIAAMRNVEDEVLRLISIRRDWMSKYNIMATLVRNPKTPLGVVLPLINRLTLRDLKGLKDDKGVQQAVREMAKKVYLLKTQKH